MNIKKFVVGYLDTNCYVLNNNKNCIIIDPGDNEKLIDNYINLNNFKVIAILITHYHFDHIGSLDYFKNKYNVKIFDYNKIGKHTLGSFNFEVIETFGHTIDSVSFYFEKEKAMFTGDFLFKNNIGRYDFEESSVEEMQKSIKLIKKYNEEINIFPGHGEITRLKEEFKNNYYLNNL